MDEVLHEHWQSLEKLTEAAELIMSRLDAGLLSLGGVETELLNLVYDLRRARDDAKLEYDAF